MSRFFYPPRLCLLPLLALILGGCAEDSNTPVVPRQATQMKTESRVAPTANATKAEAWTDAERLAARKQDSRPLSGGGESMNPLYGDGTMLVTKKIPYEQLKAEMVVVYMGSTGRRVAHRLLRLEKGGWVAKGDNNSWEDKDRVTRENYIGVVYANIFSQ